MLNLVPSKVSTKAQLQGIKDKLPKKGTLKKTEKVHEKVVASGASSQK